MINYQKKILTNYETHNLVTLVTCHYSKSKQSCIEKNVLNIIKYFLSIENYIKLYHEY